MPVENLFQIRNVDRRLLSGMDEALADAARRSGEWLACRAGCYECCLGPFEITQLDAMRLREGLAALSLQDPPRAARVRERTAAYVAAVAHHHPEGIPGASEVPESMENVPCPVLDPESGRCDLYESRPVTCRAFGAATRMEDGAIAACELCYAGATEEETAGCAVDMDPEGLEGEILAAFDAAGIRGITTVAFALAEEET